MRARPTPTVAVCLTLLLAVAHGLGTPRPLEGYGAAGMRHLLADDQSGLDTALTATTRTLLQGNTPVCASTTSNGYACTQPIPLPSYAGSWSLSYSVTDSSTPPTNPCTATLQSAAAGPLPNGATNWMHFLLSTTTAQPGSWIACAFAAKPNSMGNARAVMAGQQAAGSAPFVATYALTGQFLPNADTTPWAQNIGFATVGTTTLLCFSKPVALASSTSGRRLAQVNLGDVLTVGSSLGLNVASGRLTSMGPQQHASQAAGTTLALVPTALAAPTPSPAAAPAPSPAAVTKADAPSPAAAPTPSPASVGAPVPASHAPAPAPTPTPTPTASPATSVPARTAASPSPAAVAAPGGLTADALNKASSCSADANGYACARTLSLPTSAGSWSLSYTVADTATPPTNPCTAALQAAASGPLPNGATHWMHFLLSTTSAPAGSWIACAFAAQPNVMGNALAVLAGQQAAGSAPFAATYQLQTEALPDADATPWAQNIGFATVGTTTLLCFSKPVALASSTSGRRLAQANLGDVLTVGSSLNLNVASGALTSNGPQQHSGRSRAGTTLTLVDSTGTTTPTTPAPSPSPAATPAPSPSPSAGATSASLITPDSLNAAPGCQAGPNLHGYQCNRVPALDRPFTLSYTASTSPVPPNNLCTQGFQQAALTLPQGANAWLHFMVTAQSAGWISMAFARRFNQMSPADAVIGWVDAGRGFAAAYQATDYATPSQQDSPNWVYNIGASTTSDGRTALCFTRPALLPGFSGSSSGRRLSQLSGGPYVDISSALNLNFASAGGSFPEKHDFKQGISLDIASGASSSGGGKDLKYWVRAHGALMVAAFIFAMPTAILFARHKTLVPKVTLANKLIWFWLHMGLQLCAVVCFLAGIIIAWVHFEDNNIPTADNALSAHSVLGVIVLVLVGIQVLIGLIRPAPEHKKRWMWNLLHHNWGRVAVLLAWVNVAIGIYLWSELFGTEDNRPGIWRSWTIAVCVIAGVLLLVEVALDVVACTRPRSSPQQDTLGATPSPSTDLRHDDVRVNMQQVPMAAIRTSPEAHKAPMAPHHLMAPRPQV